jgi:hypothetical protein
MEPSLALQYPEIKTYSGQGIDDPAATTRFDWTPEGLHAIVLSEEGASFVEPLSPLDTTTYISYFNHDISTDKLSLSCMLSDEEIADAEQRGIALNQGEAAPSFVTGTMLRTYRLAVAATGEFTQQYGGGNVNTALSRITTLVNQVNAIYRKEATIAFQLIGNETSIIFTDAATDGYTNDSPFAMLSENQTKLNAVIGSGNYDIGHVFGGIPVGAGSVAFSGIASRGVVCASGKARGVSSMGGAVSSFPHSFFVVGLTHEIAHQFSAPHSFNSTTSGCSGNRTGQGAYEPGSGSTLMGYSVCGSDNLQPDPDLYFHTGSLEQIVSYASGSGSCAATTATGNGAPTIATLSNFTIPANTPFVLNASVTDPNGDALTCVWEEFDLGTASPPNTDDGTRPIFRSWLPTSSTSRNFPRMQYVLNNANSPPTNYSCGGSCLTGETLPSTTRTMNFRITARDNRAAGGGTANAPMQVSVVSTAGPFAITQPNSALSWGAGTSQLVTWSVANTANAPVNCANVRLLLSTDGGNTFPQVLSANTLNDGSETVVIPNTPTSLARIKVEAVGNIFFDISNANFTIGPASTGDGTDTIGLFRPGGNFFFLRNTNSTGFPDISVPFGAPGDLPLAGDWDGDGDTTIGLYRPSSSSFFLRNSNTAGFPDIIVSFGDGPGGDIPIVGDWNGDGVWTIGVYRPSTSTFYLRNSNTSGFPDISVPYGAVGDMPVVGDWDGNGTMTIGLYRPSTSTFFLRNSNTAGFPDISVPYGAVGDRPVVGDWNGDGTMTIGLYRPGGSIFFLRNSNTAGFPDLSIPYGAVGDTPIVGDWDGL